MRSTRSPPRWAARNANRSDSRRSQEYASLARAMKLHRCIPFALILTSLPLLGANIVANPSFNGGLTGWLTSSSTTFDATADATGVPGSGSASDTATFSGNTIAISQCIAATAGNYTLSGKILIPSGQATTGVGSIGVTWFGGVNCSSGPVLGFNTVTVTATGSFVSASAPTVAPSGTTFAFVNGQHIAATNHVIKFDDIVLD